MSSSAAMNSTDRPLAATQASDVLLETMALLPYQGPRVDETRDLPANGYLGRLEPERPLATLPHTGHPVGHD
jgi:hypothetical protein